MNILISTIAAAAILFLPAVLAAQSRTFFEAIAGHWEGTLEYQDYSENKRVRLKTYLTVTPSADGNSAEFLTVYDDFGRIISERETERIEPAAKKYLAGDFEYRIDSLETGKLVLSGSGQDGETVEPIRKTIAFDGDSLVFLKETRTPWQFRNQTIFRRASAGALARRTFSPDRLKADLEALRKTVTALHPGIYRYQTPATLEKLFAEYDARLTNSLSEGEFFRLIAQLAARFYCGHTYLNPYNQQSLLRERLFGAKTYLPFYFRIVDGRLIVTENASGTDLARGSEIAKINGVPAKKIVETLLTVTKADGRNTLAHRVQSLELTRFEAERYALFDWYFPLFFPFDNGIFTIEAVDFATGKRVKFQTPALAKAARTAEIARRYGPPPTYDDGWKFELRDRSTAYLKIENSIVWRLKKIDFKKFLAAAFAELRAKNIENLIIDLRGNDGGSMDIGYELARYLARQRLPPYAAGKRLVRLVEARPELLENLDTYSDELKNGLRTGVPENAFRRFDARYFEITNREDYPAVEPAENNFRGRAFVVSDASNASATFQFLNYAQENRLARIVGQSTGGSKQGINGGNYFFLSLPNSGIEIDIPVYFQAPPAPAKDEGVIPDVPVKRQPADIGRGFDRELAAIDALIGKK